MPDHFDRPPTPQAMMHRLPDKPDDVALVEANKKPSKFLIIVVASHAVAGKLQVAQTVSAALACPLFQGDSLHESAAKAATVGTDVGGANEGRYQRMWLSKMTRTGLLFPDESRAAGSGFSGFGGSSSTSTSRRGSASSDAASDFSASDAASLASSVMSSGAPKYINKPPTAAPSQAETQRKANPALVVLTHPKLEWWQKACIRKSVGDYSIGVVFVPLDREDEEDEDDLPILRPLDPSTMTSFGSLASFGVQKQLRNWMEEIVVRLEVDAMVDDLAAEAVKKLRDVMNE